MVIVLAMPAQLIFWQQAMATDSGNGACPADCAVPAGFYPAATIGTAVEAKEAYEQKQGERGASFRSQTPSIRERPIAIHKRQVVSEQQAVSPFSATGGNRGLSCFIFRRARSKATQPTPCGVWKTLISALSGTQRRSNIEQQRGASSPHPQ
jgi:hypothetical protein